MSTGTTIALFAISGLSLAASATTLAVVLIGGKKVEAELSEVRAKSNAALRKIKLAVNTLEI